MRRVDWPQNSTVRVVPSKAENIAQRRIPADTHFQWHPDARLFGPEGEPVGPDIGFQPLPKADDARSLARVLQGHGHPFRIGGEGALEAGPDEFETLTGGSLGRARRVVRSQASWVESFAVNGGLFGIKPGVQIGVLGSLVHSLALYAALEGLHSGATVHLLNSVRPDKQAARLAAHGVQIIYATPAQLRPVLAAGISLPDLRHVIVGGAKLDAGLYHSIARLAPKACPHEFYGAAETSFITLASGAAAGQGSVGQPYPGVTLRIDDHAGLVWVQSPYLFRGYAGSDIGSARWQDGWLTVGEVGQVSPDGLHLRGRAGRMVTVADRNVFPEEIEAFLLGQPGVEKVAVLPVVDGSRGNVLVAHLVGDEANAASLLMTLRRELGPMLAPRRLFWRKDWPQLPSGKTDLAALAAAVTTWR